MEKNMLTSKVLRCARFIQNPSFEINVQKHFYFTLHISSLHKCQTFHNAYVDSSMAIKAA